MSEVQQSPLYSKYIQKLGWRVVPLEGSAVFMRHIPLLGTLAKLQRPETLPSLASLASLVTQYRVKTLAVEPVSTAQEQKFRSWVQKASRIVHIHPSPFLPTKTLRVQLSPDEAAIFQQLEEAKQRGVRRAKKHGVIVKESGDVTDLIRIKNKSAGIFGFITTHGLKHLWSVFAPKHATILLAYSSSMELVGGVLLIFWGRIAYYWIAGATNKGKKLFAPTILAWEAILVSKKRGNAWFDFVGMWDERIPSQNKEWLGFTKFKKGFGGTELYYPIATPHK